MDENNHYMEEEKRREADAERQVQFLLEETHIWRVANSAQWVAWGIVQAKLPADCPSAASEDVPEVITEEPEQIVNGEHRDKRPEGLVAEALLNGENVKEAEAEGEGEEDAFDYLAYAKERAMFFWGDVVSLGIVKREELPEGLVRGLKIVEY
jgi:choline kinase